MVKTFCDGCKKQLYSRDNRTSIDVDVRFMVGELSC
jgi:hypothetical protein